MLKNPRKLVRVIDPRLEGQYPEIAAQKVAALAYQCLSYHPKLRPTMAEVVRVLEPLEDFDDAQTGTFGTKLPVAAKKKVEKVVNPLFEKRPEQFGIGGALPPKKDLHRFVRWPQVVRMKMILKQRLKVPPPIHQFSKTLDKNLATSLFKMILKYRPEDRAQKKDRFFKRAHAEAEGKTPSHFIEEEDAVTDSSDDGSSNTGRQQHPSNSEASAAEAAEGAASAAEALQRRRRKKWRMRWILASGDCCFPAVTNTKRWQKNG
ncbi:hypothetical protein SASPL_150502 [Salvia splendens]|uniref:60S ribosomal protein L7a n=1 Tax=Salvia splendens TaxID=180675 RepID=A0A8X8W6V4_SALSN|nr:hypothetical protein SASPL_150502 [Salvia splendens]